MKTAKDQNSNKENKIHQQHMVYVKLAVKYSDNLAKRLNKGKCKDYQPCLEHVTENKYLVVFKCGALKQKHTHTRTL